MSSEIDVEGKILSVLKGDITLADCDAIVNAANSYLQHGGGVAAAIVRRGGDVIQEECDRIGYTPTGRAAISGAGKLKARYVIHAVGPVMGEGNEDALLASAVGSALSLALEYSLESIAFPAISTGIFGYPVERCARILLATAYGFMKKEPRAPHVSVYLYSDEDYTLFREALSGLEKNPEAGL